MTQADVQRLRAHIPELDVVTPTITRWGTTVTHDEYSSSGVVKGVLPDMQRVAEPKMRYGRYINQMDIQQCRKVCVLGKEVYVNPDVDERLGIPLGMKVEQVKKAIEEHPNAVAVLVNNPTYYGICSDLRTIVELAHSHGMLCLADEAHGRD